MDKEFLGVRIKAWLVVLAIFVLVIGVAVGIILSPRVIGSIIMIILSIWCTALLMYLLALVLDSEMD